MGSAVSFQRLNDKASDVIRSRRALAGISEALSGAHPAGFDQKLRCLSN